MLKKNIGLNIPIPILLLTQKMPCQRFDFLLKVLKKIYLVSKHFQSMRWNRNIISLHRRSLVVLLSHPHLLLHRQPRGLPHRGQDGGANQLCGRPRQSDGDRVRRSGRWLHSSVLEEFQDLSLLENVGVHVVPAPRPGELHQGGDRASPGVKRKIRISHRVLNKRIR